MKYIFIIVGLLFLMPTQALAARMVDGSIPTTTPLQPAPANVAPNFGHTIEANPQDLEKSSQSVLDESNRVNIQENGGSAQTAKQSGQSFWQNWGWLGVLLVFAIAALAFYLNFRKDEEK
jgi:hypothetical protein